MIHGVQTVSYKTNQALVFFSSILETIMEFAVQIRVPPSSPAARPEHQPSHPCPHPPARSPCWRHWWRSRSCPSWRSACVRRAPRRAAKHSLVSDRAQRNMSRLKKPSPRSAAKVGELAWHTLISTGNFWLLFFHFQTWNLKAHERFKKYVN